AVEINGDMTPGPVNQPRPDDAPHEAAGVGNDLRELMGFRAASDHRDRTTGLRFQANVVSHAKCPRNSSALSTSPPGRSYRIPRRRVPPADLSMNRWLS